MTISTLLRIHPRFFRSVHLEKDLKDPTSSQGYVVTPTAKQAIQRIAAGLQPNSTQRAWRLAGDYGSGKSGLGLILARIAEGRKNELPKEASTFLGKSQFVTAVATGDYEPVGITVLRALGIPWGAHKGAPATEVVVDEIHSRVNKAQRGRRAGLVLILDELGKNLEYSAAHPECQDVFLLQRLAEEASRSGEKAFVVVVMLHQAIADYASGLESSLRREWDKIAGRFEEIVYSQPLEQIATLVAATLDVNVSKMPLEVKEEASAAMARALEVGLYGMRESKSLAELAARIYPLHATALPVIARTMRRIGQNERSLFSFLSSSEPKGLQEHCRAVIGTNNHYRVHHFFDYVRLNLLPSAGAFSAQVHWGLIDALMASIKVETSLEDAVIKTVAMLNLLDSPDLPATQDVVCAAVGERKETVKSVIRNLRNKGVFYERGTIKGLCLWPHTSVNLDEVFARGLAVTTQGRSLVCDLCKHVGVEQLVPRGYYVSTGTLRYAAVKLISAEELEMLLSGSEWYLSDGADLNLQVVVAVDFAEQKRLLSTLKQNSAKLPEGLLLTVVAPPRQAFPVLKDLIAWEWVLANTPELSSDMYAREEVRREIRQSRRALQDHLRGLHNLGIPGEHKLEWVSSSCPSGMKLASGRELLHFLGAELARIYCASPLVQNELINRRAPSSAAVAARTKLIEAMAKNAELEFMGLDTIGRPPEVALYLSILKKGGFHVKGKEGWEMTVPSGLSDTCNLGPAVACITRTLKESGPDALVPVNDVCQKLLTRPYGLREGLLPLVLAIYLSTHQQHVAVYEDGTYRHQVGGSSFLRLMKEPECFHLQYCELEGVRATILNRMLRLLRIPGDARGKSDLIDLIRPLVVFISQEVPEYSRKTSNLTGVAIKVRAALMESRQPSQLIFVILPSACGLDPTQLSDEKSVDDFGRRLSTAIHEIRTSYANLLDRLDAAIYAAFGTVVGPSARQSISDRAAQLSVVVTEPALKAFAGRLSDSKLERRSWLESVGSLLTRKSPERWSDLDEIEFYNQLGIFSGRFKRTELSLIGSSKKLNGHACRVAFTKSDGTEVGELINWDGLDETRISSLEGKVGSLLEEHGRYGLVATLRAVWAKLEPLTVKDELA